MKNYETPILEEQIVEIEDIIAKSGDGPFADFDGSKDKNDNWE